MDELVHILNENRAQLENEIMQLSETRDRLKADILSFSDEKHHIAEANDLHRPCRAYSNHYAENIK